MDTARVQNAAKTIAECETALMWLEQYGNGLSGTDKDAATVQVHLNFASACPGSKEAANVLTSMARFSLPDIVEASIRNCRNTVAMEREAIREELERQP